MINLKLFKNILKQMKFYLSIINFKKIKNNILSKSISNINYY